MWHAQSYLSAEPSATSTFGHCHSEENVVVQATTKGSWRDDSAIKKALHLTSSPGFCWHQDTCDAQTICRPSTHTRKIKSTGCSCREPGFRSQHPQCSSQWSVAPEFQGIHWPLLALWASGIHIMHIINTCRPNTHTHKININFKKKMNRLSFHTNGLITILKRALSVI